MDINKIRYPELNPIIRMNPNPEILLGEEIFWQEKRDGSNIGIYLDDNGELQLRSRNLIKASEDFYDIFERTEIKDSIIELIEYNKKEYRDEFVVFGELLTKGKSPTKTEIHEKDEFIVFDIYSVKNNNFISYIQTHQLCYQNNLSIVELYGSSNHITLESLLEFRDQMLETAKEKGREGVVGKTYHGNEKYLYFKEKLDLPTLDRKPRKIEDGKIMLPPLPDSEILGALDKVLVDIGTDKFRDVKEAMPLFAKYVSDECKKHNCNLDRKIYQFYESKIEEIMEM